jgi:hypothetical protein
MALPRLHFRAATERNAEQEAGRVVEGTVQQFRGSLAVTKLIVHLSI